MWNWSLFLAHPTYGHLFVSRSQDHVSFNRVNRVEPVHASDRSRSPSMFQQSSMRRSSNTSKVVVVALVTSIGSDSWFNVMAVNWVSWNRPGVVSRPPSSSNESCSGGDPSDSPRRSSRSCPRSGLSRIKVDVLRTWSPPDCFTVPSSIGYLIC